ncbi:MAG: 1,4-alpha-glucan branching protein GlgB [Alphaproteobacteria bacterium]|nr:1,4-alpha-glucan branching protein GlgB [Alphaproteobacteria bacterium]
MRRWTQDDSWHFHQGSHDRLYEVLGAFPSTGVARPSTLFRAWVPDVEAVSVIGDFNDWSTDAHPMKRLKDADVWEVRVRGARPGQHYKLRILTTDGRILDKADPFATLTEAPPQTASRIPFPAAALHDDAWLARRAATDALRAPMSVYEVHAGSWDRHPDGRYLGWRELAPRLADHVTRLGFTHVELLPVMEHPYDPSWGYQVTGYFAPTARFGSPDDLRWFIAHFHQRGLGVILDWVPAHFPTDAHGLYRFNGDAVFEHPDPRRGWHPDWTTAIFDFGRPEVRSFLLSSACYWLDVFHADGLRVDAVASMLYLDYSRQPGEWLPNALGGRENLEAIDLVRAVNQHVHARFPGALTIAEESTAWPGVTAPIEADGLGFDLKWDMGWMNDSLRYLAREPIHRGHHHDEVTFRPMYQYAEHFVLPLSHDEVVHGKRSLVRKMPGDAWQARATLRLLLAKQWAEPGKKLLFMGSELAPDHEWNADQPLPWQILATPGQGGIARLLADLNALYRAWPALADGDADPGGFTWVDWSDKARSVLSWLRLHRDPAVPPVLFVANFTPEPRDAYRLGVPVPGAWTVLLDTDAGAYGGSDYPVGAPLRTEAVPAHKRKVSLTVNLPPLGALFLAPG